MVFPLFTGPHLTGSPPIKRKNPLHPARVRQFRSCLFASGAPEATGGEEAEGAAQGAQRHVAAGLRTPSDLRKFRFRFEPFGSGAIFGFARGILVSVETNWS